MEPGHQKWSNLFRVHLLHLFEVFLRATYTRANLHKVHSAFIKIEVKTLAIHRWRYACLLLLLLMKSLYGVWFYGDYYGQQRYMHCIE